MLKQLSKTNSVNLGIDGTSSSTIVDYAVGGYLVYYKYVYTNSNDSNSPIIAFDYGWQIKTRNEQMRN